MTIDNTDSRGPASRLDDATLGKWLAAGLTDREMAKLCGLKQETVSQRRQKYRRNQK